LPAGIAARRVPMMNRHQAAWKSGSARHARAQACTGVRKDAPGVQKGGGPAGWPRRPRRSIPLLPSGPGGIFDL